MAVIQEDSIIVSFQTNVQDLRTKVVDVNERIGDLSSTSKTVSANINNNFKSINPGTIIEKIKATEGATKALDSAFKKLANNDLGGFEEELTDLIAKTKITADEFEFLINNIGDVNNELAKLNTGGGGFFSRIKEFAIGGVVANGITAVIGSFSGLGSKLFDTTAKFQQYESILTNTLGSSEKAAKALALIKETAAGTVFSVDELTSSYLNFANRGINLAGDEITKLADIAASQGKSFDQLTEAVLDAQTGEFERLKEFGIKASKEGDKVTATFKGQTTTIANTEAEITKLILSYGELAGVQGANAAQMLTLNGRISNIGDSFDALLVTIGNKLLPLFTGFLDIIANLVSGLLSFVNAISQIPAFLNENSVAIGFLIAGILTFNTTLIISNFELIKNAALLRAKAVAEIFAANKTAILTRATTLLNAVMRLNPIGLIVTAVLLLAAGMAVLYKRSETVRNIVGGLFSVFKNITVQIIRFGNSISSLFKDGIFNGLNNIASSIVGGIKDQFKGAFKDFTNIINGEDILNSAISLGTKILNLLTFGLAGKFLDAGKFISNSFLNGFEENKIQETLKKVTGSGGGAARNDPKRFEKAAQLKKDQEEDLKKDIKSDKKSDKKKGESKKESNDKILEADKKASEKALKDELDAKELEFQIEENNARRVIKNAEDLELALKKIELRQGIALSEIRLKNAIKNNNSLGAEKEIGERLKLNEELSQLTVRVPINIELLPRISFTTKSTSVKVGIERIKELRQQIFDGILKYDEGNTAIEAIIKDLAFKFTEGLTDVDLSGKQSILYTLLTGGDLNAAEIEADIKNKVAKIKEIEGRININLAKGNGQADLNDLQLERANAEIDLEKTKADAKKKINDAYYQRIKDQELAVLAGAKELSEVILGELVRRKDKEIEVAQQRLTGLLSTIDQGNTEQVQLEEERLAKLTDEREKYANAQKRIAAIEIAANNAVAISAGIKAVAEGFAQNIFVGIAKSLALAAQIAATISVLNNAFGPSFKSGIEDTGYNGSGVDGQGGFRAILHPKERVLTAEQNAPLLRAGISNRELPQMALMGLAYRNSARQQPNNNSDLLKQLKTTNKKLDALTNAMQGAGMNVSISDEGILTMSNRANSRIGKLKQMRQ